MSDTSIVRKGDGPAKEEESVGNEEYEQILMNIEPVNPFFKIKGDKTLLEEDDHENLNVMVFNDTDLDILHQIFPQWDKKYFKIKEFIKHCQDNSIGAEEERIRKRKEQEERGKEAAKLKVEKADPEMDLLHDPLNTTLPWELNCYRWPGVNYKSHVELYWGMITVETFSNYPKIEFTFFNENKYLNDMRYNWDRKISLWSKDLQKIRPLQFALWSLELEEELRESKLLFCLKNNVYKLPKDKITPLHRAENKFIIDYLLKVLFPHAETFESAAEMWLQIKKTYLKSNLKEISDNVLKNFQFNSLTRTYHIRHWIEKTNSFPLSVDLPPYKDQEFIDELLLKCRIYYNLNSNDFESKTKLNNRMTLNDVISTLDKFNAENSATNNLASTSNNSSNSISNNNNNNNNNQLTFNHSSRVATLETVSSLSSPLHQSSTLASSIANSSNNPSAGNGNSPQSTFLSSYRINKPQNNSLSMGGGRNSYKKNSSGSSSSRNNRSSRGRHNHSSSASNDYYL